MSLPSSINLLNKYKDNNNNLTDLLFRYLLISTLTDTINKFNKLFSFEPIYIQNINIYEFEPFTLKLTVKTNITELSCLINTSYNKRKILLDTSYNIINKLIEKFVLEYIPYFSNRGELLTFDNSYLPSQILLNPLNSVMKILDRIFCLREYEIHITYDSISLRHKFNSNRFDIESLYPASPTSYNIQTDCLCTIEGTDNVIKFLQRCQDQMFTLD